MTNALGDWNRLTNRLSGANLIYKGQKIPSVPGELLKAIEEYKVTCQNEGLDIQAAKFPEKALTYNKLIKELEDLCVLEQLSITVKPQQLPLPSDAETLLLNQHHKDVTLKSVINIILLYISY